MKDLPLADADAGVTALMGLVAVMTSEVLHGAIVRDGNFIDGKKTEAFSIEHSLFESVALRGTLDYLLSPLPYLADEGGWHPN